MTFPPDLEEKPPTSDSMMDGCARSVIWLVAGVVYLVALVWMARRFSGKPEGVIYIGGAVLLFVLAAARPPFVRGLRFDPTIRLFGNWQKSDRIGEAYLVVFGLILLGWGLYELIVG